MQNAAVDELVVRTKQGDAGSFCSVVETLDPEVRRFVAARCYRDHVVDDLVQGVFIFAYEHVADYQEGTDFRAWLLAIARTMLLARFRSDQRRNEAHERYVENMLATHAIETIDDRGRDSRLDALQLCLGRLGKDAGDLIRLRYYDGKSMDDIGSALNRSVSWAKTSLFRIKKGLLDCIKRRLALES